MFSRTSFIVLLVQASAFAADSTWRHGWDNSLGMQVIDFGYEVLDKVDLKFITDHYRMYSMEKCTGKPTEVGVWEMAKQLKALDPTFHPVFYWDVDQGQLSCYNAYTEFMAHPDWWAYDVNGQVVNSSTNQPLMNYSNPEARSWWINVPLGGPEAPYADVIDGVLADGFSQGCPRGNFSVAQCDAMVEGRNTMVAGLQALFKEKTGGRAQVIGNGLVFYPGLVPDYNIGSLEHSDGIMCEHFGVFEDLLRNGQLNVTRMHNIIATLQKVAKMNKTIVVATWPGLLDGFKNGNPTWPNNTQPTDNAGWREAIIKYHPWALAEFLTVVEDNVWQQYELWYAVSQGAVPCPEDPTKCIAPDAWYPDLSKPLGKPLGPAKQQGNVYTREFEHATSVLDLDTPLNSRVTFKAPSNKPLSIEA